MRGTDEEKMIIRISNTVAHGSVHYCVSYTHVKAFTHSIFE